MFPTLVFCLRRKSKQISLAVQKRQSCNFDVEKAKLCRFLNSLSLTLSLSSHSLTFPLKKNQRKVHQYIPSNRLSLSLARSLHHLTLGRCVLLNDSSARSRKKTAVEYEKKKSLKEKPQTHTAAAVEGKFSSISCCSIENSALRSCPSTLPSPPHLVSIPKKASDSTPGTQHPNGIQHRREWHFRKWKKKFTLVRNLLSSPTARISPLLLLMPFAKGVRGAAKVEKKRRSDFAFDLWQQQKETNSQVVWLINKQEQLNLDKVLRRTGWKKINLDNEAEKSENFRHVCVCASDSHVRIAQLSVNFLLPLRAIVKQQILQHNKWICFYFFPVSSIAPASILNNKNHLFLVRLISPFRFFHFSFSSNNFAPRRKKTPRLDSQPSTSFHPQGDPRDLSEQFFIFNQLCTHHIVVVIIILWYLQWSEGRNILSLALAMLFFLPPPHKPPAFR